MNSLLARASIYLRHKRRSLSTPYKSDTTKIQTNEPIRTDANEKIQSKHQNITTHTKKIQKDPGVFQICRYPFANGTIQVYKKQAKIVEPRKDKRPRNRDRG